MPTFILPEYDEIPDLRAGACVGLKDFTEWPDADQAPICASCPVRDRCRSWALSQDLFTALNSAGLLGGLSPADQANIIRDMRRRRRRRQGAAEAAA